MDYFITSSLPFTSFRIPGQRWGSAIWWDLEVVYNVFPFCPIIKFPPPPTNLVAGLVNLVVHTWFQIHSSTPLHTYFSYGSLWPYVNLNVKPPPSAIDLVGEEQNYIRLSSIKTKINHIMSCRIYMRTEDPGTVLLTSTVDSDTIFVEECSWVSYCIF